MKYSCLFLLLLLLRITAAARQAHPGYDSVLASQLKADKYGMRLYVLAILKTGPNDKTITDKKERSAIFKGHMDNINRLAEEHLLVVAGPFESNAENFRGIFILNVPTIAEAQKLVETDPAIRAGIFITELYPWYGSASLQMINDLHKRIAQQQH